MTYDSWKAHNPQDDELGSCPQPEAYCQLCGEPLNKEHPSSPVAALVHNNAMRERSQGQVSPEDQ
jgi:hypothetical protein